MSSFNTNYDFFTCRKIDDFLVIESLHGASKVITTVSAKEDLMSILKAAEKSQDIKGIAILTSYKYPGNAEYKKFLHESLENETRVTESRSLTVRSAVIQFLEFVHNSPIPIIGGLDGDIGPLSLGINLAFDLRIASERSVIFNQNLEFGFPPSALLSFYFVRIFGSPRATEMLLTKTEISAREAHDLGLISHVVPAEDIESECIEKLRKLATIHRKTLIETRRILQPSIEEIRSHINDSINGALRCVYKIKT